MWHAFWIAPEGVAVLERGGLGVGGPQVAWFVQTCCPASSIMCKCEDFAVWLRALHSVASATPGQRNSAYPRSDTLTLRGLKGLGKLSAKQSVLVALWHLSSHCSRTVKCS